MIANTVLALAFHLLYMAAFWAPPDPPPYVSCAAYAQVVTQTEAPLFVLYGPQKRGAELLLGLHKNPLYNIFITMKIDFANNLMEICHRMRDSGADIDAVLDALSDCMQRIVGHACVRGSVPDDAVCRPGDKTALADFAKLRDLPNDICAEGMMARGLRTVRFCDMVGCCDNLSKYILGKSCKPEANLTVVSPAVRLYNELHERGVHVAMWDIDTDEGHPPDVPGIYSVGARHDVLKHFPFSSKSIAIYPFGHVASCDEIKLVRLGRRD